MANTKLTYSATPNASYPNKEIKLTINAMNTTVQAITMDKQATITITIPAGMVTDQNLQASTPEDSGYYVKKGNNPGEYVVKPDPFSRKPIIIKPNVAWKISFPTATIAKTTDTYNIGISEEIGGHTEKTSIPFTIEKPQEKVIAWLDPKYVGDQQTAKLYWQVPAGTTAITISGYPNREDVPVPNVTTDGSVTAILLPGDKDLQRNYQVNAKLGDKLVKSDLQVLQKNAPIITSFVATSSSKLTTKDGPAVITEVDFNDTINLNWLTDYATSVMLTSPSSPGKLVAHRDTKVLFKPGGEVLNSYYGFMGQLPAFAEYYLTVEGMDQSPQQMLSIKFKPVELLYYKYTSADKNATKFATNPPNWIGAEETIEGDKFSLTFYQFGGQVTVHQPSGILDGTEEG